MINSGIAIAIEALKRQNKFENIKAAPDQFY
jgi:hypothetical protein